MAAQYNGSSKRLRTTSNLYQKRSSLYLLLRGGGTSKLVINKQGKSGGQMNLGQVS